MSQQLQAGYLQSRQCVNSRIYVGALLNSSEAFKAAAICKEQKSQIKGNNLRPVLLQLLLPGNKYSAS